VKENYLSIETLKCLSGLGPKLLEWGEVGQRTTGGENVSLGEKGKQTFDLASAAMVSTSDDALEAKAQQMTSRVEGDA
jgi:hypothetical protein